MPSLTARLVDLIESKPISENDLLLASRYILDALANAYAGRATEPGRIVEAWARDNADPGRKAFRFGALTHILEVDDLHRESVSHPGCVVVPAACAMAASQGSGGREFLVSVIKGFEAMCRVGAAFGPAHYQNWHNTATCGPFGSAYAAGSLLGLDTAAMINALGNAGTQSAGFWEFVSTGAMSKHLHAGRAAEAGVVAAELAAGGFTGAPKILEGARGLFAATCPDGDPDAVLKGPDAPWQISRTSIKPWPSCRHTHPAMDAAMEAHAKRANAEVAKISVRTYGAAIDVCNKPTPRTEYEAKFSLQHCVATALGDGEISFASFDEAARARHRTLAEKVCLETSAPYSSSYPSAWGAEVLVQLNDGHMISVQRAHALGDPEAPIDPEHLEAKAFDLIAFGGASGDALIGQVKALITGGSPAGLIDFSLTAPKKPRIDQTPSKV